MRRCNGNALKIQAGEVFGGGEEVHPKQFEPTVLRIVGSKLK